MPLATEVFTSWRDQLAVVLAEAGVPTARAPWLARTIVADASRG